MSSIQNNDPTNRIALITGASRGIGRAIALALAETGAHIIATARTQGALEELDDAIRAKGGSSTLVPMDLRDLEAIDRLGLAIHERWGKLDILVGNAGLLGPVTPLDHIDQKYWDDVMTVNVTANWRLIKATDGLLKASPAGRAIFITSSAAHNARAYWGAYATSKAALDMLVRTYAEETQSTPVRVMLVNPGPLRTKMRAQAMPGEDPETLPTPEDLTPHIVRLSSQDWGETGKIFDFPRLSLTSFQAPA